MSNIGWPGFLVLLLLALFLWGPDRLPQLLKDIRGFIRKARQMASKAAADLSKEVGTDIKVEDLHPKTFIRKHVLSEEDEAMLKDPLQGVLKDLDRETDAVKQSFSQTASSLDAPLDESSSESSSGGQSGGRRRSSSYGDAT
ncbi:hypothetical protein [Natronoglycomyces albus]|uniref:Sec-independent protein translocase protein TatB n=1 Tax=Natronoglycomyces albus TaxID=2811108 RepID=A0A895XQQ2_9ACTN|nr:hypothetical protein [Natronoglycomyces albus]QSB04600.1 hypothetical protein JQS30_12575 [Natronoglycomyces albus]